MYVVGANGITSHFVFSWYCLVCLLVISIFFICPFILEARVGCLFHIFLLISHWAIHKITDNNDCFEYGCRPHYSVLDSVNP